MGRACVLAYVAMATVEASVYFDHTELEAIDESAENRDMSRSAYIRSQIRECGSDD